MKTHKYRTLQPLLLILMLWFCLPDQGLGQNAELESQYTLGYNAYDNSNYEAAISHFSKCIEISPKNVNSYWMRGLCYQYLNKYDPESRLDIATAIKYSNVKDDLAILYTIQATNYKSIQDYETAIEFYGMAIKINKPIWAYRDRAQCYYENEQYQEAIEDYLHVINNTDKNQIEERITLNEDLASAYEANAAYKKAIKVYNNNLNMQESRFAYYGIGWNYEKLEQYNEAIAYLDLAVSKEFEGGYEFPILRTRGKCYAALEQYQQALSDFNSLLTNFADHSEIRSVYLNRAWVNEDLGELEKAINDYTIALDLMPSAYTFLERGYVYEDMAEYALALKDYEQAETEDWLQNYAIQGKARCYAGLGNYQQAIACYDQLPAKEVDKWVYYSKGELHRKNQAYTDALVQFNNAIALDPNFSYAYNRRGYTKELNMDKNSAIEDYDKAIQLSPDMVYTYLSRARLTIELFGKDAGKKDLYTILEKETTVASSGNCRQYALLYLGKNEEALQWMDHIIEAYPNADNYYDYACMLAIMNRKQDALHKLQTAIDKGFHDYHHMAIDFDLNNIKFSSEFDDLLARNNIKVAIPIPISDVDIYIPETNRNEEFTFALIIGNEDYSSFQKGLKNEINVSYAKNDAHTFKQYCISTLGIPERNITYLTNASAAQMWQGIDKLCQLAQATNGQSKIVFYYAGHGLPDQMSEEGYLIPVDVSGSNLQYAVKLQDVYNKLGQVPTQRTMVFLDACFSGGARSEQLLANRGVKIKPKKGSLSGNMIVMASCSNTESAQSYNAKRHGLFTYYLLKAIKESAGNIRLEDLYEQTTNKVKIESILVNGQGQTPSITVSPKLLEDWKNWQL